MSQTTLSPASIWILDKFLGLEKQLEKALEDYELAHFVDQLYTFLWDNYANWYLEYLKTDKSQMDFAKELFEQYLLILHPFDPFLTEYLWETYLEKKQLLAFEKRDFLYASKRLAGIDETFREAAILEFDTVVEFIEKIRSLRGLFNVNSSQIMTIYTDFAKVFEYQEFLTKMIKVELTKDTKGKNYSVKTPNFGFSLDISAYIQDVAKEIDRTNKQIQSLEKQISALENQLKNQEFLQKAQIEVIDQKNQELEARKLELEANFGKLKVLG